MTSTPTATRDLSHPDARRILTSQAAWAHPQVAAKLAAMANISPSAAKDILKSIETAPEPTVVM